ncbi:ser/Thr protein phosphatase family protein [Zymoseptoria brevis]|uniref:Ser/Thr protein phosphatase family protein n=1 Tax=Zymoseptoria brevis TaxID=1047168 RepID=A0A0F4GRX2_9PEZI|nr:ser/Thr protein phosphatase family protein [Zymoseptoria brevis]
MTLPTKFLFLSDTHNFEHDASKAYPLCQPMPKVDVVLHCGDLTYIGGLPSYRKALKMLGRFDAELKLVIAGNHDVSLDGEYWRTSLGKEDDPDEHDKAVKLMTGRDAEAANVTYLTEGLHTFTLKSGVSFNIFVSPYQPEFCDWAFGYKHNEDRWNIPPNADIVMTHGPPQGSLDVARDSHLGCAQLAKAIEKTRPLLHCFGHIHEGYGVDLKKWDQEGGKRDGEQLPVKFSRAGIDGPGGRLMLKRGESTLMINAAIMNDHNKPENAPWLIELPLSGD